MPTPLFEQGRWYRRWLLAGLGPGLLRPGPRCSEQQAKQRATAEGEHLSGRSTTCQIACSL